MIVGGAGGLTMTGAYEGAGNGGGLGVGRSGGAQSFEWGDPMSHPEKDVYALGPGPSSIRPSMISNWTTSPSCR